MEVKPGYKQTEVGVIPEEWEVSPVRQNGEVLTGKALAVNAPGRQRPYLRTKNVFDGRIDIDDVLTMPMTNEQFIPVYLEGHPGKTKIAAGLACGFIWTIAKGLKVGDVVITPNGTGRYHAGEITGPYRYVPGQVLPHRRPVRWFSELFDRADMSEALQRSTNSTGTCCDVTEYAAELDKLIGGQTAPALVSTDPAVEDPAAFAMEKHLEDFLVVNWAQTELGKQYTIYSVDGEQVGQQFPSDTGPIDILAISKDGKTLLVVELKKGRASDVVLGQIQRYMGYVLDELAEEHQTVKGIIIALEDDLRLRRAMRVTQGIEFCRYQVNFTLIQSSAQ